MTILVVAAHPDDEILGCGGTIARLSKMEDVFTLILGEGITSRHTCDEDKTEEIKKLKANARIANKKLNVKEIYLENFPDNKFDSVPLLDIVKIVERHVKELGPETIFTHHCGDLNLDHSITNRAVFTACRPVQDYTVKKIVLFETLSSTEWNRPDPSITFIPNYYVDISSTIDIKITAMRQYKNEIRQFPHPRSIDGIKILSQKRGLEVGMKYAEAFHLARCIEW